MYTLQRFEKGGFMWRQRGGIGVMMLAVALVVGCDGSQIGQSIEIRQGIPRDQLVLELVLRDLAKRDDLWSFSKGEAGALIIVDHENQGAPFGLSYELQDRNWPSLAPLAADLKSRNAEVSAIPIPRRSVADCIVVDFDDIRSELENHPAFQYGFWEMVQEKHPDWRFWVMFCLPGYSVDGNTALVRLSFGPSPHGATATYLVKRSGNTWVIEWCEIAYYS